MIAVRVLPQAEAELLHEVEYYSKAGAGPLVTGFPFSIVYRASELEELPVVAIAPHRRRPGYWLPRIM